MLKSVNCSLKLTFCAEVVVVVVVTVSLIPGKNAKWGEGT